MVRNDLCPTRSISRLILRGETKTESRENGFTPDRTVQPLCLPVREKRLKLRTSDFE